VPHRRRTKEFDMALFRDVHGLVAAIDEVEEG